MTFTEFLLNHLMADPVLVWVLGALLVLLLLLLLLLVRRRRRTVQATSGVTSAQADQEQLSTNQNFEESDITPSATADAVLPVINTPAPSANMTSPAARGALIKEIDQLIDIEESLMALRELYHRQLITPEVYVNESKKIALRLLKPE